MTQLDGVVFENLLDEQRELRPSEEFSAQAVVSDDSLYREAAADATAFWEARAKEIAWMKPWTTVCEWKPPHARWFLGGKLNLSANCLDVHLSTPRRNKAALIWEGENFEQRTITYAQLHRDVSRFASALRSLGIAKGDRVAIYLPMIPEAVIAMLACARLGAIHTVVFAGFSPEALADRINDCEAKLLITADGGWRRGAVLQLKHEADKALRQTPCVRHVVVVKRPAGEPFPCQIQPGRDHWYHRLMESASPDCPPVAMDAEDELFVLYTSGTTGKPKGIVHTTGGYSVGTYATTKYVFDLRDEDIFWCTADVGWITGHSYVVYGPLQCGATVLIYEGAPNHPEQDRFWDIVARHRVNVFYTAPTAIRAFMKWGVELPERHDLTSLRLLGTVGEPINPEAWMWYRAHIGQERCPIVDTWWQTETGAIMITGLPGASTMKPGYAGPPFPGVDACVLDEQGREVREGTGLLAIRQPWPSMLRTIWGDDERYVQTYFSKWDQATYFPGDGAKRDAAGNFMILGRVDDVLNVSGHRIGTMEVESALVDHPATAEAAVVGRHHEVKGQAIVAFVSLKAGQAASDELRDELKAHVVTKIGALARPEEILITSDLPKTRSGKIMRRLLRDIADGRALGDTTTLADASVVEALRKRYEENYGS